MGEWRNPRRPSICPAGFIDPCVPIVSKVPPRGPQWIHEIKHDGYRLIVRKADIVRLARRELVWINVTRHPTAEWIAQQITEAYPWNEAPRYLIRDRDAIFGAAVTRRLRAMGIRDKPIAPGSPWQIGTRRD